MSSPAAAAAVSAAWAQFVEQSAAVFSTEQVNNAAAATATESLRLNNQLRNFFF